MGSKFQSLLVPGKNSHVGFHATSGLHTLGSTLSFFADVGISGLGSDSAVFPDVVVRLVDEVEYLRVHGPNQSDSRGQEILRVKLKFCSKIQTYTKKINDLLHETATLFPS